MFRADSVDSSTMSRTGEREGRSGPSSVRVEIGRGGWEVGGESVHYVEDRLKMWILANQVICPSSSLFFTQADNDFL